VAKAHDSVIDMSRAIAVPARWRKHIRARLRRAYHRAVHSCLE
jgi:hypothetical protein